MKRLHIHVGVQDLDQSIKFYSTLFKKEPDKLKSDYAKWMLEDPKVNFAISLRSDRFGVDHLGFQMEDSSDLKELSDHLKQANLKTYDEGESTCCYAKSDKVWLKDPSEVPWEIYQTLGDADQLSESKENKSKATCCVPKSGASQSCC